VFVTHDQDEALSMSDRIMVMNSGRILRSGTPEEIYTEPGSRFVAEFIGQCNFLTGRLARAADGTHRLIRPEFPDGIAVRGGEPGAEATIAVRPEDIVVTENPARHDGPQPAVLDVSYLGDHYQYRLAVGDIQLIAVCSHRLGAGPIQLHIPPDVATLVG
jgi:iron(III) transport system ATP-binding protein